MTTMADKEDALIALVMGENDDPKTEVIVTRLCILIAVLQERLDIVERRLNVARISLGPLG